MININALFTDERFFKLAGDVKLLYIDICSSPRVTTLGVYTVAPFIKGEFPNITAAVYAPLVKEGFLESVDAYNYIVVNHFCKSDNNNKAILNKAKKEFLKSTGLLREKFESLYNVEDFETKIKVKKEYNEEVKSCYNKILPYFEQHHIGDRQDAWLDTIDKLNKIDNVPFIVIEEIVKRTRKDDFWSKNFLSLLKLRNKNKEGIKHYIVFAEKFNISLFSGEGSIGEMSIDKRIDIAPEGFENFHIIDSSTGRKIYPERWINNKPMHPDYLIAKELIKKYNNFRNIQK